MESEQTKFKQNAKEQEENSDIIDEEELQDQFQDQNENLKESMEDENEQKENSENDFLIEEEDEIKKDFDENNLEKLNENMNNDVLDFNFNLDNIKKGININPKQEFFDIFFDPGFYTNNRKIEVEKLVQYVKKESNHGLTGLKNLKNTGFINTILQCLSHTLDLTYYIISKSYANEINKNSRSKGTIINSLHSIISSLWTTSEKHMAPSDFKFNLLNYLPQYANSNLQFDASEFLLQLLDLLSEELSQTPKKFKSLSATNTNNYLEQDELGRKMEGESDVQASKRFWNFHKNTGNNNSIITDLFHGQYKSSITCLVCENTSVYFEPFSTLVLEIPEIKRVDFLIVSSHFNLKPVVKLTCFIPMNALFQDIAKFTIEKYRKEPDFNEFEHTRSKLKCLLVNTTTFTARFVKLNDSIYQASKKGNIVIYEINEMEDESDYYPYICMIRENTTKNKEEMKEDENVQQENINEDENLNIENIQQSNADTANSHKDIQEGKISDNKDNQQEDKEKVNKKQNQQNKNLKKENLKYAYNRKEDKQTPSSAATSTAKEKEKQKEAENDFLKNLSFPRLFNLSLDRTVRDLRINLYAFMRKLYKFDFKSLKSKHADLIKTDFTPLNQINLSYDLFADAELIKNLSESDYESYVEEEFKFIFEDNFKEISQTDFIKNFPYTVKLVSAKDELKFKILFSNNLEEYNSELPNELGLDKLNQYIKTGYKVVLEINKNNKEIFSEIKNELNKVISIHPKNFNSQSEFGESENGNLNKTITLEDCLDNFTLAEKLEKGNEWYCSSCKKNQNSLKRMELYYIPKNLMIMLKRFERKMIGKTKIQIWKNNNLVKYPVNNLTLGRYFASNNFYKENNISYDLYAISQHSGSIEGGHYATACRNFGKWYELDDATVFPSDEQTVVSAEGYILFYRRKEPKGN